jgi:adenylosuccinate synthase
MRNYSRVAGFLREYAADTSKILSEQIEGKKNILFESAQGTMLDLDFGTYPYVTSSNPISGGVCTGAGVSPKSIEHIIGITKAYTTRVGEGPFPTELTDATGEALRARGKEFGATTGRPRRCGWFDAVQVRYSVRLNGVDFIALTKLDVLSDFPELKICTGYKYKNKIIKDFPVSQTVLKHCVPQYVTLKGFSLKGKAIKSYAQLPSQAKKYIEAIEKLIGCRLCLLSMGSDRDETAVVRGLKPWID